MDRDEQSRLDERSEIYRRLLRGEYWTAPNLTRLDSVLDLGCGTGTLVTLLAFFAKMEL